MKFRGYLTEEITIKEYEYYPEPFDVHIPIRMVGEPYHLGYKFSMDMEGVINDKEFEKDHGKELLIIHLISNLVKSHPQIWNSLVVYYDAYRWICYGNEIKVHFKFDDFTTLFDLGMETSFSNATQFKQFIASEIFNKQNGTELTYDNLGERAAIYGGSLFTIEQNRHHVLFEQTATKVYMKLFKMALEYRYLTYRIEKDGKTPSYQKMHDYVKNIMATSSMILDQIFQAAEKFGPSFKGETLSRSISFDIHNDKVNLFYGKSCYTFSLLNGVVCLGQHQVNLRDFFIKLEEDRRVVRKHVVSLLGVFSKGGITINDYPGIFSIIRYKGDVDQIVIRLDDGLIKLRFDHQKLYRDTGEEVLDIGILVNEALEISGKREKAKMKARQFFRLFLDKDEKKQLAVTKMVCIKGQDADYLFTPYYAVNPIIKLGKKDGQRKALCVMTDNPYIPRFDVLASAIVLIKAGREEELLSTANSFDLSSKHTNMLEKFEKIRERNFSKMPGSVL